MRVLPLVALALILAACQTDTAPLDAPPPTSATEASPEAAADTTEAMEAAMPTAVMADPPMQARDEVIAEGTLVGTRRHPVTGRALLYRLADGTHSVRLEGLESDNGPDLRVWLLRDLEDRPEGRIDLGPLKSTRGNQNYEVPTDAPVAEAVGVAIWCRAFSVNFGTASFQ
ncbi:MAG: DM13 domain-containing protein [Bacteroidota bacterium]